MSLLLFLLVFATVPLCAMMLLWWPLRARTALVVVPFLWILLIPIATVWMQAVLLGPIVGRAHCELHGAGMEYSEVWHCPSEDVWPTLLPGLLNLVPLAWLILPDRRARFAGLVAGLLGFLRFGAPLVLYLWVPMNGAASGRVVMTDKWFWTTAQNPTVLVSWVLWALTLPAAAVVLNRAEPPDVRVSTMRGSGSEAEPDRPR